MKKIITSNSKLFLAISFVSNLGFILELKAQVPKNCSEIHYFNPSAPSGVYVIDPDGSGPTPTMNCQCDMTTDGGGWSLVLNYNHLTNTNPALKVRTDSLPLQNQTALGFNESGTVYWGHADTSLMRKLGSDQVRFYGITSGHSRVLNFKTSHAGTVSYFKTGIGSTSGISTNFTALAGHTTFLPAAIDMTTSNKGNYAMTEYPLWTGSTYHWYLGGTDPSCSVRWEVDDYPCNVPSTFHQIWVKQSITTGFKEQKQSKLNIQVSPNPFNSVTTLYVLNATSEKTEQYKMKFTTMLGAEVFPTVIRKNGAFTIERGSLSSGVYFCEISDETNVVSVTKLIVE